MREPDGFGEFVDEHSRALLRAGWLLTGDWASAEDLVQTALAAAWPRWQSLTGSKEASVRRIMTTTFLRWRKRRWTGEISTSQLPDDVRDDATEQVAERRVLLDALATLPRQQRAAIVLRYFADQTETQAAAAMGCSVGAVKSHTARAVGVARDRRRQRHLDRRGDPMTVDEQLRAWLHETAPEPPRTLSVQDLRPARRAAHRRLWLPALAAAGAVAAAVLALAVSTRAPHHGAPSARSGSAPVPTLARTGPTQPSPTSPGSTPSTTALPLAAWGARALGDPDLARDSLIGDGGALFAYQLARRDAVVRLDPTTGRVAARLQFVPGLVDTQPPVLSSGRLWVLATTRYADRIVLTALDPTTLHIREQVPLHASVSDGPALAAADGVVYVGSGQVVTSVDARTGRVLTTLPVPGNAVTALAARAGRLYVGTADGAGSGSVLTLDASTGTALAAPRATGSVYTLAASAGGVWWGEGFGMSADVRFSGNSRTLEPGGGGADPTVTVLGPTVWLGGPDALQCADPGTGAVRAHVSLLQDKDILEQIGGFATARGALYSIAQTADGGFLVRLQPPAACAG